jgi:ATP-binding cassette subfamily C protein
MSLAATAGSLAAPPSRPRAEAAGRLRLRDHGVTPFVILIACALTLAAQLAPMSFILIMFHVSDGVLETRNYATLVAFSLLFLAIVVMAGMFTSMRGALFQSVAERFGLHMRAVAMQAAIRNAVRTDASEGVTLLQDINVVQGFLRSSAPLIVLEMLGAMVPLSLLFYFDVWLGIIAVGGLTAAILMGVLLHVATRGLVRDARRRLGETSADLSGQLAHPDLVRGLGMLWATMMRWQPRYDAALGSLEDVNKRVTALEGIEEMVLTFYEVVIKSYTCYLLFIHVGTLGLLMAVSFFAMLVVSPFSNLARSWQGWAFALQSWRRIQEALADYGPPVPAAPDPGVPPGLVLEGASFHPAGRPLPIIGDLTLRLPPGTVATVEGPNGVGKSTLLRLVLGLMPPTVGRVLLDGQDTYYCDRAEFGARIGYLPQDVQLIEGSVFHNIGRGPGAPPELVVQAARIAGAHEMIGRLPAGYQTPAGTTSGLSAGQRRLIGLARALYGLPRLLVLDEPEVGMDGLARVAMRAAVTALRERGAIVLIVTHEPDTWRDTVDLRLLLSAGGGWKVQAAKDQPGPGTERGLAIADQR